MDLSPFKELPDDARLWIYAFDRALTADEATLVRDRLTAFMDEWHSHKKDVTGTFTILEDRFVILSGASRDGISGCSIDSSVANFKHFRDEHGLDGLNRNLVFWRDSEGVVRSAERAAFREEVASGRLSAETSVFDTTAATLGDLREGRFERPMRESWHAKVFLQTQP
jgi:hypothetical protein